MEDVLDRTTYSQRCSEFRQREGDNEMEWIAEQIQRAYLAGWNRIALSEARKKRDEVDDTGIALVRAINYTKDKGFRK